jgi:hypothetical protein
MNKPWYNQPTPFVDKHSWVPYQSPRVVSAKHARDLERRLRHAERLLAAIETDQYGGIYVSHCGFEDWREQLLAHLESAGRLDYE